MARIDTIEIKAICNIDVDFGLISRWPSLFPATISRHFMIC